MSDNQKEVNAAIKIQAVQRGKQVRDEKVKQEEAAIKIQAIQRGKQAREETAKPEEDKKGKKSAKVAPAESVVPLKSKHATRMGKLRNLFRAKTRIEEPVATQKTKPITVYPYESKVTCVDYSKDGRWLACATGEKVIVRHIT